MRKKLSEMTPIERVETRMRGLTLEEAEDIAVYILSQVVAKRIFAREEGKEYLETIMKRIFDEALKWADEHAFEIALVRSVLNNNHK